MSTLNAVPFRSTIFYTAAGVPASAGSVLTVGTNGVPGFTTNLGSTTISLGASTNQTYNSFTNGLYASTLWGSTLTGLTSIQKVSMSYSGQYQLAVQNSSTINSSRNSGFSWSSLTGAAGLPAGATAYPQATASGVPAYTSISASATGQYILASVNGGLLYTCANGTSASPTFTAVGMGTPTYYMPLENNLTEVMNGTTMTTPGSGGAPGFVAGIVGSYAVNLANTAGGTPAYYLRLPVSGFTNVITVSGWFNLRAYSSSPQVIWSTGGTYIVLYINSTTANTIGFNINNGPGVTTSFAVSLNTWYSFTAIAQGNGTCYLYINNVLIGTYAMASALQSMSTFSIGTYDTTNLTYAFNGLLDDIRIYNSAVTYSPIVPMNWSQTAVSGTGQYMLAAVASGGLFQSSNYGATWSQVTAVASNGLWTGLAMSYSGQYMLTSGGVAIIPNQTSLATSTWTQNGVIWGALASSFNSPSYPAYKAFNTTTGDGWLCDNVTQRYTNGSPNGNAASTTIQTIGATAGEWLQIQSSIPLVMTSFALGLGPNPSNATNTPKTYYIVGSNDGTTWFPLQNGNITFSSFAALSSYININTTGTQTLAGNMVGSVVTTAYSYSTNAYTFFRLICTTLTYAVGASTYAEVGEWSLNFVGGQSYSTNYGGAWTTATTGLYTNAIAMSGTGQYTFGANNNTLPQCYLTLDGTFVDSFGGLTAPTVTGSVPFSTSIFKTGSASPLFSNTAGSSTTTNYITYTVPAALSNPASLSVSCWIYPLAWPASNAATPFAFANSANTQQGPYFQLQTTGLVSISFFTTGNSNPGVSVASISPVPNNTWTHVVCTYTSGIGTLYINGVSQGTVSTSGNLALYSSGGAISRFNLGCIFPNLFAYNGYIDDVRIYTTALSPTFVYAIYATPSMVYLNNIGNNYLTNVTTPSYIGVSGINAVITSAALSSTGQYMVVLTQGTTNNVYYSTNYGATFTALTLGSAAMTSCAISADGSYITVSNATTVYTLNRNTQGYSVSIGNAAGVVNQGQNAIAIGNQAGVTNQSANSIILNSSGSTLDAYTSGFYVSNIADYGTSYASSFSLLAYGSDSQILKGPAISILMAGSAGTVPQAYCTQHTKSILANNFQQFEWTHLQSNNSYGYGPASVPFVVKIATLGANISTTYGIVNIRGQAGGWLDSNTMYFDINIITRGSVKITGTITGPYAAAVAIVDLVYVINSNSQYDIYLYSKYTYIVYDVMVSGNTGNNTLYDPSVAAATSVIPSNIVSITSSIGIYQNGTYPLSVTGNINVTGSILYNGVAITTGSGSIWTAGSGGVAYYNGGNVGIGSASPVSALQVNTPFTSSGIYPGPTLTFGTSNPVPTFWQLGAIQGYVVANAGTANGYPGGLAFLTKNSDNSNTSSPTVKMVLDSNGNLGIGTTNPGNLLNIYAPQATVWPILINYSSGIQIVMGNGGSASNFMMDTYNSTTGGRPALCLNNSGGNVGIGTGAPTSILTVGNGAASSFTGSNNVSLNNTGAAYFVAHDGTRQIFLGADSSGYGMVGSYTNHDFVIRVNNSERMRFATSGSVGIGTTNVRRTLDVVGTPSFPFTYAPTQLSLSDTVGSSLMNLLIGVNGTSNYASIQASLSGTGVVPLLLNGTGGNVGIGTSNPTSQIHLHGTAGSGYWSNSCLRITNGISTTDGATTNGTSVQLQNGYNAYYFNMMVYGYSGGGGSSIYIHSDNLIGVVMNRGSNAWSAYSDSRMKIDVTPLPSELSNILKLNPVSYLYDMDPTDNVNIVTRVGFLADEVFDIYPNLVTKDSGMPYTNQAGETFIPMTMCMTDLIPYHTKAIQELASQATSHVQELASQATSHVQELASQATSHALRVQELASENAALKAQVASLLAWAITQGFSS